MSLDRLLTDFAAKAGVDSIPVKQDGSRVLVFDGRYKVTILPEGASTAILRSRLGKLPEEDVERREELDRLLQLSTSRMRASGDILSYDEERRELVLHHRFPVDLQPHDFSKLMGDFVNSLAFWQRQMTARPLRPAVPPPFQMMFR
ncbi:CesT family type III secretion system chaperone [Telmatospirillum sp. J64-1]|uniref:CesT family type III secretion system chaperone n=1 Tax=Telmatospirillum sp. J64-1 TaxID=2502183 RepID=UPI00163D81E9|nr:CesT family type III secretion system chaperone [Telmatospirillum sp. J64-1]